MTLDEREVLDEDHKVTCDVDGDVSEAGMEEKPESEEGDVAEIKID